MVYDSNNKIQRATAASVRSIIGAGTSNLAIGTTATTAAAGNHTHDYLPLAGGTLTGNLSGKYITGTWLQTTASTETASYANIAVLDSSGWVYKRSKANLKTDLGVGQINIGGTYYTASLSGTTLTFTRV